MKRAVRLAWVVASNGFIVWVMSTRLFGALFNQDTQSLRSRVEFSLEAILPILGIVFEFLNLRSARRINVGYLALAGGVWLGAGIWWRSDSYDGVLLILAFGLFIFAGVTELIYRKTKGPSAAPNPGPQNTH